MAVINLGWRCMGMSIVIALHILTASMSVAHCTWRRARRSATASCSGYTRLLESLHVLTRIRKLKQHVSSKILNSNRAPKKCRRP